MADSALLWFFCAINDQNIFIVAKFMMQKTDAFFLSGHSIYKLAAND